MIPYRGIILLAFIGLFKVVRSNTEDTLYYDHSWTKWTRWSPCNTPCGGGHQERFRNCDPHYNKATVVMGHLYGQQPCPKPSHERRVCNTHSCSRENFMNQRSIDLGLKRSMLNKNAKNSVVQIKPMRYVKNIHEFEKRQALNLNLNLGNFQQAFNDIDKVLAQPLGNLFNQAASTASSSVSNVLPATSLENEFVNAIDSWLIKFVPESFRGLARSIAATSVKFFIAHDFQDAIKKIVTNSTDDLVNQVNFLSINMNDKILGPLKRDMNTVAFRTTMVQLLMRFLSTLNTIDFTKISITDILKSVGNEFGKFINDVQQKPEEIKGEVRRNIMNNLEKEYARIKSSFGKNKKLCKKKMGLETVRMQQRECECPKTFLSVLKKTVCFCVSNSQSRLTFVNAVKSCLHMGEGFNLLTLEDGTILATVQEIMPGKTIWLGLTDQTEEGVWTWIGQNKIAQKTSWFTVNTGLISHKQPDGGREENCATINVMGLWFDVSCDRKFPFICMKALQNKQIMLNSSVGSVDPCVAMNQELKILGQIEQLLQHKEKLVNATKLPTPVLSTYNPFKDQTSPKPGVTRPLLWPSFAPYKSTNAKELSSSSKTPHDLGLHPGLGSELNNKPTSLPSAVVTKPTLEMSLTFKPTLPIGLLRERPNNLFFTTTSTTTKHRLNPTLHPFLLGLGFSTSKVRGQRPSSVSVTTTPSGPMPEIVRLQNTATGAPQIPPPIMIQSRKLPEIVLTKRRYPKYVVNDDPCQFRSNWTRTRQAQGACTWSVWSSWSNCSRECNGGFRVRARSCDNVPVRTLCMARNVSITNRDSVLGDCCKGDNIHVGYCNLQPCIPVNGAWSSWSEWSTCSATCGAGKRTRGRTCTNPKPKNGGVRCPGSAIDLDNCDMGVSCL